MHELSIAGSVLQAVQQEMLRHPGSLPVKVGMRIGELTAVDEDALRFSFEAITQGTEMEGVELAVEISPRRHRCLSCSHEFQVRDFDFSCPQCGGATECISGDELDLAYLEVEENEPGSVGTQSTQRK